MLRLAITGGLASGKSTVSVLLRERGCPVVDADQLGHEILQTTARPAVLARFGTAISNPDGRIDHARLAALVFAPDADGALLDLNRILHPLIMACAWEQLRQWEQQATALAGIEATLLIEAGLLSGFDHVLLVTADREVRIARFLARTGATREQAEARMTHQLPDEQKIRQADIVIANNGTPAALAAQVDRLLTQLLAKEHA